MFDMCEHKTMLYYCCHAAMTSWALHIIKLENGHAIVRDFGWNVPLTLPGPGRVEEEINKFSRTLTTKIPSTYAHKGTSFPSRPNNSEADLTKDLTAWLATLTFVSCNPSSTWQVHTRHMNHRLGLNHFNHIALLIRLKVCVLVKQLWNSMYRDRRQDVVTEIERN